MKITAQQDTTLIELLLSEFKETSRTRIKKMIKYGCVKFKNAAIKHEDFILKKGNVVEFTKYAGISKNKGIKPPFPVLYEDEYLIAVLKPAGVLTVGTTTERSKSLFASVAKYVGIKSKGKEGMYTVHRLDREVAGIVLLAKSGEIREELKNNWDKTTKLYYALVEGTPAQKKGKIESWLRDTPQMRVESFDNEVPDSKFSITHYEVVEQHDNHALLKIKLETGRKNQIRVHMQQLGTPIVGDRKYGADSTYKRQIRLLAYHLTLLHPITRKKITIETALPANFLKLYDADEYYK